MSSEQPEHSNNLSLGEPTSSIQVFIPAGSGCDINLPQNRNTPATATLTNGRININITGRHDPPRPTVLPNQYTLRMALQERPDCTYMSNSNDLPKCRFFPEKPVRVLYSTTHAGANITLDTPMKFWRGSIHDPLYDTLVPSGYNPQCETCKNYFCSKECIDEYN